MKNDNKKSPITQWAHDDKPREKLLVKGKQALSLAELLAILLGSGLPGLSAVDMAQILLAKYDNDLNLLAQADLHDLMKIKGIGQAKAVTILAAMELGRRQLHAPIQAKPQITSSRDAYQQFRPSLIDLIHEEFWILILNRNNRVVELKKIGQGGFAGTYVDVKMIFKFVLAQNGSSVVLAHNHPSGNLKPSSQDIGLTQKIVEGGKVLDIMVLDHIILGGKSFFSFKDNDLL